MPPLILTAKQRAEQMEGALDRVRISVGGRRFEVELATRFHPQLGAWSDNTIYVKVVSLDGLVLPEGGYFGFRNPPIYVVTNEDAAPTRPKLIKLANNRVGLEPQDRPVRLDPRRALIDILQRRLTDFLETGR